LSARSLLLIDADLGAQGYLAGILQRDDREVHRVPGSRAARDELRADVESCLTVVRRVAGVGAFIGRK